MIKFFIERMALSVSIVVPVYNVENYIADCFQSIVNQTYHGPMECLFIDDCGTDNSIPILKELIKAYDGAIEMRLLHHEKNKGLSGARNTGITNAKGDYLFFLDSDDQLYPYSISCLVDAALKENMPDMVLGSYRVNIPNHPINQYCNNYDVINSQPAIAKAFLDDKLFCMAPNKLVRRDFILENLLLFKEGIIHEDNLWSFQSFHLAQKVVTIPEKTYYYLIHLGSIMTSKDREKQIMCARRICDEVKKDFNDHRYAFVENDSQAYLDNLMVTKCGGLLNQVYMSGLTREKRVARLKAIPDDLKSLMVKYLFSSSPFMRVIRILFQSRCYGLFDQVMCRLYSRNMS